MRAWTRLCQSRRPSRSAMVSHAGEQVKLLKSRCGVTVIPKVKSNPKYGTEKYDPDYELPEYIDAKAPKGEAFCIINVQWKNVGKKPASASSFDNIDTANGTEYDRISDYGDRLTNEVN